MVAKNNHSPSDLRDKYIDIQDNHLGVDVTCVIHRRLFGGKNLMKLNEEELLKLIDECRKEWRKLDGKK